MSVKCDSGKATLLQFDCKMEARLSLIKVGVEPVTLIWLSTNYLRNL